MTAEGIKDILKTGGKEFGLSIGNNEADLFLKYLKELKDWNKKINLTAIKEDRDIVIRHFLDSLTLAPFLSGEETILDIGSGAGFPGIPLKIIIPSLRITLMDSVAKKVVFMRHIIWTLGLKDIEAVQGRGEDVKTIKRFEACFDIVTSRAFAELGRFLDIAMPYAKKGGILLSLKGPKGPKEIEGLKRRDDLEYIQTKSVKLPFSDVITTILSFKRL